jgi:hypothetical protein
MWAIRKRRWGVASLLSAKALMAAWLFGDFLGRDFGNSI